MNNLKDFIKQANELIRKESRKINNLHKQVEEYETVIDIIAKTGEINTISLYREKIQECYLKIDNCFENIKHNRDVIATMRKIDKIIKRGEKIA